MARIAKADYFAGVFLTTILKSAKTVPMLCDATGEIKRVVFDTDIGAFNVYVKYSTAERTGWDYDAAPKKKRTYWDISFSDVEQDYLMQDFQVDGKRNLVALVCTNAKLGNSKIAIMELQEVLFCLKTMRNGGSRGIQVSRTGGNHTFDCAGCGLPQKMRLLQYHPFVNHLRFFDNNAPEID